MKKQLLLSTVLAAALTAGSAYAAGGDYGKQASDTGASGDVSMDRSLEGGSMERQQTGQMGGSASATGETGYNPARVGAGGVAADQSAQLTNNTDAVRQIQQALQEQGHDIQVDGIWGPNTEQALMEFQKEQGQTEATGQPNQETLQALDVDLYQQQPQTAETPSDIGQGGTMGTGSPSPGSTGASGAGSLDSPGMGSGTMGSGATGTGGGVGSGSTSGQ